MGRGRSSSGGGSRGFSSSSSRGRSSSSFNRGIVSRPAPRPRVYGGGVHVHYHHGGGGGGDYSTSSSPRSAFIAISIILLIIGICALIGGFSMLKTNDDYGTVQAVATDNTYLGGWYYTTYEYTINGTDYTNRSNEGWELPETVGKTVTIYYLKDNPNIITELDQSSDNDGAVVFIAIGIIFTSLGVILLIKGIRTKDEEVEVAESTSTSKLNTTSTSESNKVECPYCGCHYNKELDSCPKCGAGRSWKD